MSLEENQLLPDEKMHLKLSLENRSGTELKLGTTKRLDHFHGSPGEKRSGVGIGDELMFLLTVNSPFASQDKQPRGNSN